MARTKASLRAANSSTLCIRRKFAAHHPVQCIGCGLHTANKNSTCNYCLHLMTNRRCQIRAAAPVVEDWAMKLDVRIRPKGCYHNAEIRLVVTRDLQAILVNRKDSVGSGECKWNPAEDDGPLFSVSRSGDGNMEDLPKITPTQESQKVWQICPLSGCTKAIVVYGLPTEIILEFNARCSAVHLDQRARFLTVAAHTRHIE